MDVILLLSRQILIMFVLMCIGFFFYRLHYISDQGAEDIKEIIVHLILPVLVINSLWIERSSENVQDFLASSLLSFVGMVIAILVAMMIYKKTNPVLRFAATFGNIGVIGIPMIQATFGASAVFYITMMLILVNLLQFTLGVYMLTGDIKMMSFKKVIQSPVVIAVIIGLLLFLLNVPRISMLDSIFDVITGMNFPIALILCGVYLAQGDVVKMVQKIPLYTLSFVRLLLIPIVTLVVFRFIPVGHSLLKQAVFLTTACPVGSNIAILASYYKSDYKLAVETVCISTLLCLLTLPIILYLAIQFL